MNWPELFTPESVAGTGIGGAGIWLFFKKIASKSATETANTSKADAYSEVIDTLRNEVKRLSDVNTELAKALNELQKENINLKREISQLHDTLTDMRDRLRHPDDHDTSQPTED